jgi:regulator of sigma E protease
MTHHKVRRTAMRLPANGQTAPRSPKISLQRAYRHSQITLFSFLILSLPLALTVMGALDSARRLALVLIGFSGIIFVHELGHFIVARLCSVRCDVFSIGIGPRLLGWKKGVGFSFGKSPEDRAAKELEKKAANEKNLGEKEDEKLARKPLEEETVSGGARGTATFGDLEQTAGREPNPTVTTDQGTVEIQPDTPNLTADILGKPQPADPSKELGETDYRISILPLGGYVRMLGQDDMDPTKISSDPRSFGRRPIWQRMCIVSAGVIMNVITAAVIFSVIFHPNMGVKSPPAILGEIKYNSPAAIAGMQSGMRVYKIDGEKHLGYMDFTDLMIAGALSKGTKPVEFLVHTADGKDLIIPVIPTRMPEVRFLAIGVAPMASTQLLSVASDEEWAKAIKDVKNGNLLKKGDLIVAITDNETGKVVTLADPTPDSTDFTTGYVRMAATLQNSHGKDVTVTVTNPARGKSEDIDLTPKFEVRDTVGDLPGIVGLNARVHVTITEVGGPADKAGFKPDDIILEIGSAQAHNPSIREFKDAIEASPGKTLSAIVQRKKADGTTEEITLHPVPDKKFDNGRDIGFLGIGYSPDLENPVITTHDNDPRFHSENLRGATITSLNGAPVKHWSDVFDIARLAKAGEPLAFAVTMETGEKKTFTITVGSAEKIDPLLAAIQSPVTAYAYHLDLPVETLLWTQRASQNGGIWQAMQMGGEHTTKFMLQTYMTLRGLFIGTVSPKELHGIVGIAKVGYDVQDRGLTHLWFILAVVSVNLAVANFLPLPIVDGGLFLLLILEKFRGRPLSLKVQSAIQIVGIVALAGLFLYVTFNDIQFVSGIK